MTAPHTGSRFSQFDRTVLGVAAAAVLAILILIWRGDQVETYVEPVLIDEPQVIYSTLAGDGEQLFTIAPPPLPAGDAASEDTPSGDASANTPVQLTNATGGVWDYAVSPDGDQIVFSAFTPEGSSDLWITQRDAATPELLLACPKAFCATPAWSPDGKLLAYSQRNANDYAAAAVSPPRLYLLDVQAKQTTPLFSDSQKLGFDPRWSADGQWLAYLAPDFFGVTVFNVETGASQFYPTTTGETGVWHPQRTVFLMNEMAQVGSDTVVHLSLVDPVAGTRQNLSGASTLVQDSAPAWSPDGAWIAFRRNELTGAQKTLSKQLWVMRSDGSDARALIFDPEADYGAPTWSADGRTLLFHKFPLKGPNIVIGVWMIDVVTGTQWPVVSPGQRPQWLP